MTTVIDSKIPPPKSYWKMALNVVYSILTALKNAGKFSKGAGPGV